MGREDIRVQGCVNVKNKPGWVQMISGYNEMQGWVEKILWYDIRVQGWMDDKRIPGWVQMISGYNEIQE